MPLENLYLSPQCGFASCEIGNKLTEDEQWAKIALVKRIAERVWKYRYRLQVAARARHCVSRTMVRIVSFGQGIRYA